MPDLSEMLANGPVVCAEGYLFECERRGYLQAGAFVPEVVLHHPEVVEGLHREFVHAGSDVVEAFTYYGHRQKLRVIGKEHILEPLNRQALSIAAGVARETGTLLAGNLSNTNVYEPGASAAQEVRAAFEEQVAWAVEAGVDMVIAETFSWAAEALLALETIRATSLPAVVTFAVHRDGMMRDGISPEDACRQAEQAGASVVGLNCTRGPRTLSGGSACAVQDNRGGTDDAGPARSRQGRGTSLSHRARPLHLHAPGTWRVRRRRARTWRTLPWRLLWRRASSRAGRG